MDIGPAADQGRSVKGLEFEEFTPVNHSCDNLPNIVGRGQVFGNDAVNLLGFI